MKCVDVGSHKQLKMKDKKMLLIFGIVLLVFFIWRFGNLGLFAVFPYYEEQYSVTWEYDDDIGQFGEFDQGSMYIGNIGYNDLSGDQWRFIRGYTTFLAGNSEIGDYSSVSAMDLEIYIISKKLECGSTNLNIIRFDPPDGTGLDLTPDNEGEIVDVFNALDWETAEIYGTYHLSSGDETVGEWITIPLNQQAVDDFKQLNQRNTAEWVMGFVIEEPTNIPAQCDLYVNTGSIRLDITSGELIQISTPMDISVVSGRTVEFNIAWTGSAPEYYVYIDDGDDEEHEDYTSENTYYMTDIYSTDGTFNGLICIADTASGDGGSYTNEDCKSFSIIIGNGECNTEADTNCDGIVSRAELGTYAMRWIQNDPVVTRQSLGQAAMAWIQGG